MATSVFEDIDAEGGKPETKKPSKLGSFFSKSFEKAKTRAKAKFKEYKEDRAEFKAVEKKAFKKERLRQAKIRGRSTARARFGSDPRSRVTESASSLGFGGGGGSDLLGGNDLRANLMGSKKKKPERFGGFI